MTDILRNPSMDLEEMIPVDQFFDAYLAQLEAAGTNSAYNPGAPPGDIGQYIPKLEQASSDSSTSARPDQVGGGPPGRSSYEGLHSASLPMSTANNDGSIAVSPYHHHPLQQQRVVPHHHQQQQPPQTGGMYIGPHVSHPQTGGGSNPAIAMSAYTRGSGIAMRGPSEYGAGAESRAENQQQRRFMFEHGTGGLPQLGHPHPHHAAAGQQQERQQPGGELQDQHGGSLDMGEGTQDMYSVGMGGSRSRKSRHRTPRQQQLNKQAQQRYRERKKAKALEMESAVETLTTQIVELKTVREEKAALEEKTLQLERSLLEKEAELQRVRSEIVAAKRTSEKDSNCSELSSVNYEIDKVSGGEMEQFHDKVEDLKNFMQKARLDSASLSNPTMESLSDDVLREVSKRVDAVCLSCMKLMRLEGPDLGELMSLNNGRIIVNADDHEHWIRIATMLKLNDDQKKRGLMLRDQHAVKMESIYGARQDMNLEAISLLLPSDQGGRAPAMSKVSCFSFGSFFHRASHRSRTAQVLENLKSNLRDEQKAVSELEYMVFHRVLNPIQGGWFTLGCYPHHCDCLKLLNTVHELYGEAIGNGGKANGFRGDPEKC